MAIGVAELGRRITDARRDLGLARQECASRARMGRTVLAKIETGARQVGAMELARLADALDMRIEWFFEEAPPAVVSRRSAAEAGVPSSEIDRRVERVAREVTFLQGIVGSLDLLAFSLDLDADTADGASITGVRTTVIRRADLVERDLFVPTEPDPPELPDVYVEAVLDAYRSVRRYRQPEPSRSCSRPGMRTTSPSCRCFRRTLSGRLCPDRLRTDTLVFDTGPLSCFARADIRGGGVHLHTRIQTVLDADWMEHRAIATTAEAKAFTRLARRLVSGDRNVGEAAVLALAQTVPARAVVDDRAPCALARTAGFNDVVLRRATGSLAHTRRTSMRPSSRLMRRAEIARCFTLSMTLLTGWRPIPRLRIFWIGTRTELSAVICSPSE